jgi:predicted nucleotide-binding protein (sugar kinase/HSP70/actin superfamily)
MQRDVNHLLARGHTVGEVLSTALRSVCENYLRRVAREGSIGSNVCFQGATARNRALVAAFEQRLGRPIRVSRFCHLTGALGTAHLVREENGSASRFRGFELFAERIPVRREVCGFCRNHCKLVLADVRGEVAAYGFLCGRDHDTDRFVSRNTSGFDLLRTRRRILRSGLARAPREGETMGLPAALHLFEDLGLWRHFFGMLGVRVLTSERLDDPVGAGKRRERAEFCAPVAAWHGHVEYLLRRADHVFAPVYFESRDRGRRQYCYTTQFASALAETLPDAGGGGRILRPVVTPGVGDLRTKLQLHAALRSALGDPPSFAKVASAYSEAVTRWADRQARLREVWRREFADLDDVAVVLLGRPYVCLDPGMNKGIPDLLGALGVKTFYQDMLDVREEDVARIADLLDQVHWAHGARILEATSAVARTPGLYPVLLTAFKCAPDSFVLGFFRRILDRAGKPYLVLELDEHDSRVGYETRIEAAVRSFRNHRPGPVAADVRPLAPRPVRELDGRRLYLPAWDRLSCELVAASLRREGVDARLLPESELTIRKGLCHNTGQCIPLHAISEGFADAVREDDIDPARAALWILDSRISCNIGMYPQAIRALLQERGEGLERAVVYVGNLSFLRVSLRAAINTYFAFLCGGMLRRLACRVRPYEITPGAADSAVEDGRAIFREAFENGRDRRDAAREVVDRFAAIETGPRDRPKVAIFGDLYVRDNDVMNQGLVRLIERHGGEVVTTPHSEYVKIVAEAHFQRWFREGKLLTVVVNRSLLALVKGLERQLLDEFARVLEPVSFARPGRPPRELLAPFAVTSRHSGESLDNLLKVFHILESDPDVSLFIQANPAFCCPSLVTEAMADRIRAHTGVPIVTVTYDGTATRHNEAIVPHLVLGASRRGIGRGSGASRP